MKINGVRSALVVLAAAVLGTGLGGCNERYNQNVETMRSLEDRNTVLTQENETLRGNIANLQASVESRDKSINELRAFIERIKGENSSLASALAGFEDKLKGIKFGQLDAATDQALRELAAQYPDLITYDAERGMIRFTSDLTFASGSDQVTEAGRRSLDALAKILISGSASGYDVRIVGHTDTQRVTQRAGRAFKDNWELSAFRSISVMRELTHMGVANERVEIAGRGEWMPAVMNAANGNTPQNRRVEVFLVRGSVMPRSTNAAPAPAPAPKKAAEDVMK